MAIGKNKRVSAKGGKKGGKKKQVDAFAKKEQYLVKAPSTFATPNIGNTLCSKSQGLKLARDSLRGRVFEVNLADLQKNDSQSHRKVKLICEEVEGRNVLTDFHGMDVTRDHLCSLIRKWHSLIEAHVDVKTLDGYHLRLFAIAFTKEMPDQHRATCYAQSAQIRAIRARMVKIMEEEASKCQLRDLVKKLIPEAVGKNMEKACSKIFPLKDVSIRKVKVLKKPKTDISKLMELHDTAQEFNGAVEGESADAKNLLTAEPQWA